MPNHIRPNVQRMTPYPPGKPIEEVQRELGLSDVLKLASNENPLGPSPMAVEAMRQALEKSSYYPDARGFDLKQKLSSFLSVPLDNIMLGCGSDEIIGVLGSMFLEPGLNAVTSDPCFMRYEAAASLTGSELRKAPMTQDYDYDVDGMLSLIDDKSRLVFLASPNNPTGTILKSSQLREMVDKLPEHVVLVLDEAYVEFAEFLDRGKGEFESGLSLAGRDNVVCLRTFSKAYGLAGCRVGYGIASQVLVRAYNAARPPFDINTLAQVAAFAALSDAGHLARTLACNRAGLDQVISGAAKLGLPTVRSWANFVCIEVGDSAKVARDLLLQGVIVRPGDQLGMPKHIRVSIGTEQQNARFLASLESVSLARTA
ncbi:MAG: histidinol-phosphate transaminase [Chthonomonadaceae bacterium]|nr:histidinol-phosphate transaminase [Chthonomonadaceae bacterium]